MVGGGRRSKAILLEKAKLATTCLKLSLDNKYPKLIAMELDALKSFDVNCYKVEVEYLLILLPLIEQQKV